MCVRKDVQKWRKKGLLDRDDAHLCYLLVFFSMGRLEMMFDPVSQGLVTEWANPDEFEAARTKW